MFLIKVYINMSLIFLDQASYYVMWFYAVPVSLLQKPDCFY